MATAHQHMLTVVTRIRHGEQAALEEALKEMAADLYHNSYFRFPETDTHFGRWAVLDSDPLFPPVLVFAATHDGEVDGYLRQMIAAGPRLDEIWGRCDGYPGGGTADFAALLAFVRAHQVASAAFYAAYGGFGVASVRNALELREKIEGYLDARGPLTAFSAEELRRDVQRFVRDSGLPVLPGSMPEKTPQQRYWSLPPAGQRAVDIALWIVALPFLLVVLVPLLVVRALLHPLEAADADRYRRTYAVRYKAAVSSIGSFEDFVAQNPMTHVVPLKPGRFRLLLLRAFLWIIDLLARHVLKSGALVDIRSVHAANWALIDGNRRLLFCSNFDGAWINYVGDFVDRAHEYLTGIWSNTQGFPPTRDLVLDGATDHDAFARFLRRNQVPTSVWYSAYPDRTARNLVNAIHLRSGLEGSLSPARTIAWLRRL